MKYLKVLPVFFLVCTIFPEAKSDTNYFFNHDHGNSIVEIFRSVASGNSQSIQRITTASNGIIEGSGAWFDESQNKLYFNSVSGGAYNDDLRVYDISSDSWSLLSGVKSSSTDSTPHFAPLTSSYSSSISSNTSNISSNDTDIASNTSNISSNDTDIASNTSNISSNDTDIASNASNISSNDTDITSNASNISSNDTDIASNTSNISSNDTDISGLQSLISTKSGSTTTARIGDSTKNILEIGPTTNPTTINQSGISVSGGNLIKKDSDGNIHIGKNSFVIGNEVLNGAHPIWAEDENGSKIPLNIYGSDLQINGVSVQGQIDTNKTNIKNLGSGIAGSTALTAALTALPQSSEESKHSCGIGSGAYSSRYAIGFGCASKINERVDINAGGSYVFGGAKSYGEGTLDNGVIKAGFVFKLGQLKEPIQLSSKGKKNLETKIETLTIKNETLQNTVLTLMARLERIEKVALGDQKSKDLAVYPLK